MEWRSPLNLNTPTTGCFLIIVVFVIVPTLIYLCPSVSNHYAAATATAADCYNIYPFLYFYRHRGYRRSSCAWVVCVKVCVGNPFPFLAADTPFYCYRYHSSEMTKELIHTAQRNEDNKRLISYWTCIVTSSLGVVTKLGSLGKYWNLSPT